MLRDGQIVVVRRYMVGTPGMMVCILYMDIKKVVVVAGNRKFDVITDTGILFTCIDGIIQEIAEDNTQIIIVDGNPVWIDTDICMEFNMIFTAYVFIISDKGINHQIPGIDFRVGVFHILHGDVQIGGKFLIFLIF